MTINNTTITTPEIDAAIARVHESLDDAVPGSKEYAALAAQLTTLTKIKEIEINFRLKEIDSNTKQRESNASCELKTADTRLREKELEKVDTVSKDTLALIAANLTGIVLVLSYERINVIASKAFGAVMKLR